VTVQRIHNGLGPIDVLTKIELEEVNHKGIDRLLRSRFEGVEAQRIPTVHAIGTGGVLQLGAMSAGDPDLGPAEGDIWMLRRVLVASSFITAAANNGVSLGDYYQLFRGSTPSDVQNSYSPNYLLDGMVYTPGNGLTGMTQPAVPASAVAVQNTGTIPQLVVISGGTVTLVTVNGVTVGTGDGTYLVPAAGAIAVTYSVAPTWTWNATQAATSSIIGQRVGVAYNAGTKSVLLQPGEQIYAQVFSSIAGVTYTLNGEAIRVPAEMKGKLLA
jgi:hypothetical protein